MKARLLLTGAVAVVALGAGGVYAWAQSQKPLLELGVGYAARVGCGCRYIGNRPLSDCTKDFEPGMEQIRLSEDVAAKTVTAYVPLIASRSVRYDPVLGCQPEKFSGAPYTPPRPPPLPPVLPDEAAVMPPSQVAGLLHQCSRGTPKPGSGTWQPSPADIAKLEAALPVWLARAAESNPMGGLLDGAHALEQSARQYSGVVRNGRRYIYGNFFPVGTLKDSPRWRSEPVVVCDGGPGFFGVEYDVEARKFTHADFNGLA